MTVARTVHLTQLARKAPSRFAALADELRDRLEADSTRRDDLIVTVDDLDLTREAAAQLLGRARAHELIADLHRYRRRGRTLGVTVVLQHPLIRADLQIA